MQVLSTVLSKTKCMPVLLFHAIPRQETERKRRMEFTSWKSSRTMRPQRARAGMEASLKVSIQWKSCYSVRESIVFRCKAMHLWAGRMVHLVKHVTCKHENKVLLPPQQEEYVLQALNPRSGESETAGSLVSAGQSGQGETLCQRSRRCSWGWHLRISSGIHTYACIPPT